MYVAHHRCGVEARPGLLRAGFIMHTLEIERIGGHCQLAGTRSPPLIARTVAVNLDAEAIGIIEVQRLAHQVIGGAGDRPVLIG
jgi:hypothetical protein